MTKNGFSNRPFAAIAPAPVTPAAVPPDLSWGKRLRYFRELRGKTTAQLANFCGVKATVVLAWELDDAHPSGEQLARLHGVLPALKVWRHLIPGHGAPKEVPTEKPEVPLTLVEEKVTEPRGADVELTTSAKSDKQLLAEFTRTFRASFEASKLRRAELADLVGASVSAVNLWVNGNAPSKEAHAKLVELFPDLGQVAFVPAHSNMRARAAEKNAPSVSEVSAPPVLPDKRVDLAALGAEHGKALAEVLSASARLKAAEAAVADARADLARHKAAANDLAVKLAAAVDGC